MKVRSNISGGLFSAVSKLDVFPVLLFIGSDKVVGDCLAPICGSMLKRKCVNCFIYGDVENPVNAKNIGKTVEFIRKAHPNHKILVVDASVGLSSDVGKIKFFDEGIHPGKAVGRDIGAVGDLSVVGIVACRDENSNISPVRLCDVIKMAEEISRELYICVRSFLSRPNTQNNLNPQKYPHDLAGICP